MDPIQLFHYGQLVHHGETKGDMRVLAKSPGITDELVDLALEYALIAPLEGAAGVSWGMVRTRRRMPNVLARAELGEAGNTMYQFSFWSSDAIRELGGNVKKLRELMKEPIPSYQMLGEPLEPLNLGKRPQPTTEEQVDSLLDLMTYTKNNTRKITPLIASIISGVPLVVTNAPLDSEERANFVHGLLALLPSSTRHGILYMLHDTPDSDYHPQISFHPEATDLENTTFYDWESGEISGTEVENEYSKFITSQMRLDAELVTRETEKLTPTAGWRFSAGDNLSEALSYASHRAKLDSSIKSSMPVAVESVAKVLSEDPTLTDDLSKAYSRHLMNFSIAMDDLSHLDALLSTMKEDRTLEKEVFDYMVKAQKDGKASLIFETMISWVDHEQRPDGKMWDMLIHKAALSELQELIDDQDDEFLAEFLDDILAMGTLAAPIIEQVIEKSLPLAGKNIEIPLKLLMLAFQHFDDSKLGKLLSSARFIKPLPEDIKRLLAALAQPKRSVPPDTMLKALAAVPENVRDEALLQFSTIALNNQRIELFNERILAELVKLAIKGEVRVNRRFLATLGRAISEKTLSRMKPPAPRLVLQMLLLSGNYPLLAQFMIVQSRDLYGTERQADYILSVQETFAKTRLSGQKAAEALRGIAENNIKNIPYLVAIMGVLEGSDWDIKLQDFADQAILDMNNNPRLVEAIPPKSVMSLLEYQMHHFDERHVRVAARLVGSANAYEKGKVGLSATNQAYKMLSAHEKAKPLALEVVLQYVRESQEKPAQHMIKVFGKQLGSDTAKKLQLAHDFSILQERLDWYTFSEAIQITVDLLQHAVNAYQDKKSVPSVDHMRRFVDQIRRDTTASQHHEIYETMKRIATHLLDLAQKHENDSTKNKKHYAELVEGKTNPQSTLDVYRVVGGYLLQNKTHPMRFTKSIPDALLGEAKGEDLLINLAVAANLLEYAGRLDIKKNAVWTVDAIISEVNSQVRAQLRMRRDDLRQMGRNLQRLSDLILWIAENSDTKVLEDKNGKGRKLDTNSMAPDGVLELFRFVYGHFSN